jgi:hypothetical protein
MTDGVCILVTMYVDRVPNRGSPPAVLLREAWREGGRVRKRTIANLSDWPRQRIETLRRLLRDEPLVPAAEVFTIETSTPHGHVEAILGSIRKLGLDTVLASKRSRPRDLILALVVERLIHPCSKLATTRLWKTTTLGETLGVSDVDVDEVYDALDWLLARQPQIEKKFAGRHLTEGGVVLYDVSSSYYEGRHCALARFGHDRDGKRGLPVIVYGVTTDAVGRPVAVEVYPGGTGDPTTVPDQVEALRTRFGLSRVVLVGDRGLLTETQLQHLRRYPGLGWISALRSPAMQALVESGALQLSLFDEQHLAEITSPAYPDERLIVCFNPLLAEERRRKRQELLAATEQALTKIAKEAARRTRTPFDDATLGVKVGKVVNHYKVGKHFAVSISAGRVRWTRQEAHIQQEAQLDGFYVIRTGEPLDRLSPEDTVRHYKGLSRVERAFRCLKGIDLRVRPIRHRTDDHVRAHIFLCLLAYYVEWHLRQAWAPLLFHDDELEATRATRDPVAAPTPSRTARRKKAQRTTAQGQPVHSFETLLVELATRCQHTCRLRSDPTGPTLRQVNPPTPLQARALELLGLKGV